MTAATTTFHSESTTTGKQFQTKLAKSHRKPRFLDPKTSHAVSQILKLGQETATNTTTKIDHSIFTKPTIVLFISFTRLILDHKTNHILLVCYFFKIKKLSFTSKQSAGLLFLKFYSESESC